MKDTDRRSLIEDNAAFVSRALRNAAYRCQIPHEEHDDFCGWAWLRLIDNDYAVLRRWRGQSSLETYLCSVINNLARDYKVSLFGKWHPSARARRLGETAELAERMIYREGLSLGEVARRIRQQLGKRVSEDRLCGWAAELPVRIRRRRVALSAAHDLAETGGVEARLRRREGEASATVVRRALRRSLRDLSPRQRELLRRRFYEGSSLAELARQEGVVQRRLYTECQRALRCLQRSLESRGVGIHQVQEALDYEPGSLDLAG